MKAKTFVGIEDSGLGLFMLFLLAANLIPTAVIYRVLWWTGAAQRDMALHCGERGEVVAHALLLTWGVWAIVGLAVLTWKAKTVSALVFRSALLVAAGCGVYRGFF